MLTATMHTTHRPHEEAFSDFRLEGNPRKDGGDDD